MKVANRKNQIILNTRKGKNAPSYIRVEKDGKNPKKKSSKIGSILANVFTVLFMLFTAVIVYQSITADSSADMLGKDIFGFRMATIVTASMEPTIKVGDLAVYYNVDFNKLKVGDPIMYTTRTDDDGNTGVKEVDEADAGSGAAVTHRVARIIEAEDSDIGEKQVVTQGEAEGAAEDKPVEAARYRGKVIFWIPKLGLFMGFVQEPKGMIISIAVLIFVMYGIPEIVSKLKKD